MVLAEYWGPILFFPMMTMRKKTVNKMNGPARIRSPLLESLFLYPLNELKRSNGKEQCGIIDVARSKERTMMRFIVFGLMVLVMSCSYSERADWDSGAKAQNSYKEEARQEQVESTRNQLKTTVEPQTEGAQPF